MKGTAPCGAIFRRPIATWGWSMRPRVSITAWISLPSCSFYQRSQKFSNIRGIIQRKAGMGGTTAYFNGISAGRQHLKDVFVRAVVTQGQREVRFDLLVTGQSHFAFIYCVGLYLHHMVAIQHLQLLLFHKVFQVAAQLTRAQLTQSFFHFAIVPYQCMSLFFQERTVRPVYVKINDIPGFFFPLITGHFFI